MRHLFVLTTAALTLALAPPASAGTYTVRACDATYGNHSWGAHASNGSVTAYTSCPGEGIVTRMTGDSGNAPIYSNAHHGFAAPPGTRIVKLEADFRVESKNGWLAGIKTDQGQWAWCGESFPNCSTWGVYTRTAVPLNTSWVLAEVMCFRSGGCPRSGLYGVLSMRNVVVTIDDPTPPSVSITGGSVLAGGWRRGPQDVAVRCDGWGWHRPGRDARRRGISAKRCR